MAVLVDVRGFVGCWRKNTLDLGLDVVDGVRGFDLEGDGLARKGLDEDLHLDLRGDGCELMVLEGIWGSGNTHLHRECDPQSR